MSWPLQPTSRYLLSLMDQHLSMPRSRGFRLVAADASTLQLVLQDVTGRKVNEAVALMLSLSVEPYSPTVGERQMVCEHLPHLRPNDLVRLD